VIATNQETLATVSGDAAKLLSSLHRSPQISLQLYAGPPTPCASEAAGSKKTNGLKSVHGSLTLFVILYGHESIYEQVGVFVTKCGLFLQHPKHCDRDVKYRNPQCLSTDDGATQLTSHRGYSSECVLTEFNCNPIDLFARAHDEQNLPETSAPSILTTELYKHQKQALTFMLSRERGWMTTGLYKDLWEIDSSSATLYRNVVTGQQQSRPLAEFRGGLLTDAPGLGKTLSVIALIAANKNTSSANNNTAAMVSSLLVVPKSLIQTWKDELERHAKPNSIKYCVYYGKDKDLYLHNLESYDLIITTYSTVRIDWKKSFEPMSTAPLHNASWKRIVLDEAHIIRAPNKSFAKSVCALTAECRWAVTGTPIQNRLRDLFSLFKFLRCHPFDDLKVFNTHVTQSWKARSDANAVAKLKTIVNALSLRRPKEIIDLPLRKDTRVLLHFSDEEWKFYKEVRARTRSRIANAAEHMGRLTFINALQWVNELRLICNLGVGNRKEPLNAGLATDSTFSWSLDTAQSVFDQLDQVNLATCSNKACSADLSSELSGEAEIDRVDEPRMNHAMEVLCFPCFKDVKRGKSHETFLAVCNHLPRCASASPSCQLPSGQAPSILHRQSLSDVSTKIRTLVDDLCKLPEETKSVIFSGWTRTFDMIQPILNTKGIRCVRLDGSLSERGRASVLKAFRNHRAIRVLLATITCGRFGSYSCLTGIYHGTAVESDE